MELGEASLGRPYPSVIHNGAGSFGGNQGWFEKKSICNCGCGLIGAADVLLYMQGENIRENRGKEAGGMEAGEYREYVEELGRSYFPVIPGFGMPGWFLSHGLRKYFKQHHMAFTAGWGVKKAELPGEIERMLEEDIPVILSIGHNFPLFWKKRKLALYRREQDGRLVKSAETKAHYVTVTAVSREYLKVSSWGRCYYINWEEYCQYMNRYSCSLFTNICFIRKREERP